jgi:hypothetical protein
MRTGGIPTVPSRRRVLLSVVLASVAASAWASAQELTWNDLQQQRRVQAGTVQPPSGGEAFHRLRIDGAGQPAAVTVLTIERPGVKGPRYALTGQVRYEGVEGAGYLELWNYFPDGSQYFSRTLAESGPMMRLQGTSGWRAFTLPFDATGAPPPTRLVFNVVLAGKGVVYLGPLHLADTPGAVGSSTVPTATVASMAGLIGGVAGALVGGIGALIGILTSLGRARRLVDFTARGLAVAGAGAFVIGLVALTRNEPYALYYPLLLLGFLSAVLPLALLPAIRKRYEQIEFRRMRAHDLA